MEISPRSIVLAYIIGVALVDGNLSNPNSRAIRLRITCDAKYPRLAKEIEGKLRYLLPKNKVSIVRVPQKDSYFNISVYSNRFDQWLPWKVGQGPKEKQQVRIPSWIKKEIVFSRACVRGLLQTDGSIYMDRGYCMINFTNIVYPLARDVYRALQKLGYRPTFSSTPVKSKQKYTVRIAKDSYRVIKELALYKA